jgi:hypothetical protein
MFARVFKAKILQDKKGEKKKIRNFVKNGYFGPKFLGGLQLVRARLFLFYSIGLWPSSEKLRCFEVSSSGRRKIKTPAPASKNIFF